MEQALYRLDAFLQRSTLCDGGGGGGGNGGVTNGQVRGVLVCVWECLWCVWGVFVCVWSVFGSV